LFHGTIYEKAKYQAIRREIKVLIPPNGRYGRLSPAPKNRSYSLETKVFSLKILKTGDREINLYVMRITLITYIVK
jgi:hypothetical protein